MSLFFIGELICFKTGKGNMSNDLNFGYRNGIKKWSHSNYSFKISVYYSSIKAGFCIRTDKMCFYFFLVCFKSPESKAPG